MLRHIAAVLLVVLANADAWCEAIEHRIGVLLRDGERVAPERWTATADYLTRQIPGHAFAIVPLSRPAMNAAVSRGELTFVLTDAGHFVYLAGTYGVSGVATAQDSWHGTVYSSVGAVVITRADRRDIGRMSDLKGKSFMADDPESFEGFQLAWWELKAHDIDPFRDFSRLEFTNLAPEDIVEAVRHSSIDAATVRAGVLEQMAAERSLDLGELRLLHPHTAPGYPFLRSTELYPEWILAKTRETPEQFGEGVAVALRAMSRHDPAAAAEKRYAAWIAPADYRPVRELLWDLQLPPYHEEPAATLIDAMRRHWAWLAATLVLLLSLTAIVLHILRVNYRLDLSRRYLERARTLEVQIAQAGRIAAMGEMTTTLAHELNQPLAAIVNYANGCIRRLRSDGMSQDELFTVFERIATEGNRSAEILRRLRDFVGKRRALHLPRDVNRIVREAVTLAELKARRKGVTIHLELSDDVGPVLADAVQIEQVVVNLVHNAIEAIDDAGWRRRDVVVETRSNARRGVDITVRDTGPGFHINGAERMFEPFVSTKRDGMGLGLSISRSIVEAHGDQLRAMPSPDGGAMFTFTLPPANGARAQ